MARVTSKKQNGNISCDARGVNRQIIFEDDEDRNMFITTFDFGVTIDINFMPTV